MIFAYYASLNLTARAVAAVLCMLQYYIIDKAKYKLVILKKMKIYAMDKEKLSQYIQEVNNQLNMSQDKPEEGQSFDEY